MKTSAEAIENLKDLVHINNDRIKGYERAIKELKKDDGDLKTLFAVFIDQSRQNIMALGKEVQALGSDLDRNTTLSGKIYRAWMHVNAVFTGHDRHNILENCEFGEDAALKAYNAVFRSRDLPEYLKQMIVKQHELLLQSHNKVKDLRDQYATS
jgi:uncharacterized protein (TIGR02284 family)